MRKVTPETRRRILARKDKLVHSLLAWSNLNSPKFPWRKTVDPYRLLVAEMLLRKTRADQVRDVYDQFIKTYPSLESLSSADEKEIADIIYPLGLAYRSKWIVNTVRNLLQRSPNIPTSPKDLELVIGKKRRYTINAIRCFAFGERVPVFDINVKRILERVFSIDLGADSHKNPVSWEIALLLVPENKVKQYNWALLDLGRLVCTSKNPRCEICPLKEVCDYGRKKLTGKLAT